MGSPHHHSTALTKLSTGMQPGVTQGQLKTSPHLWHEGIQTQFLDAAAPHNLPTRFCFPSYFPVSFPKITVRICYILLKKLQNYALPQIPNIIYIICFTFKQPTCPTTQFFQLLCTTHSSHSCTLLHIAGEGAFYSCFNNKKYRVMM